MTVPAPVPGVTTHVNAGRKYVCIGVTAAPRWQATCSDCFNEFEFVTIGTTPPSRKRCRSCIKSERERWAAEVKAKRKADREERRRQRARDRAAGAKIERAAAARRAMQK